MILKYGLYSHDDGMVDVTITKATVTDQAERKLRVRESWTINGMLTGASQSAIKTAIDALVTAYSTDGSDLILYHNDGVTESSHTMKAADCLAGPFIKRLDFPEGKGAEYANRRSFVIQIEGEKTYSGAAEVLAFAESLSFMGGGPRYILSEPIEGKPKRYQVAENTPFECVQSGMAMGRSTWPSAPSAKFSGSTIAPDSPEVVYDPPRQIGSNFTDYVTRWKYVMRSGDEMTGYPSTSL